MSTRNRKPTGGGIGDTPSPIQGETTQSTRSATAGTAGSTSRKPSSRTRVLATESRTRQTRHSAGAIGSTSRLEIPSPPPRRMRSSLASAATQAEDSSSHASHVSHEPEMSDGESVEAPPPASASRTHARATADTPSASGAFSRPRARAPVPPPSSTPRSSAVARPLPRPQAGGAVAGDYRLARVPPGMAKTRVGIAGKGLGTALPKRNRKILKDNVYAIGKPAIRRLARRGGVKRISAQIYEDIRAAIKDRLITILRLCTTYVDYRKAKTVTIHDVIFALRYIGSPIYGYEFGGNWTKTKTMRFTEKKSAPNRLAITMQEEANDSDESE